MLFYLMTIFALAGVIGASFYVFGVLLIIAGYVLYASGAYRMFQKAGISGWLAWIPFVNDYFIFKISWNTIYYWVYLILGIVINFNTTDGKMNFFACILWLVNLVIHFIYTQKLAKSYGHGELFGLGLFFFESIFIMILGYGSSLYYGPQDQKIRYR